MIILLTKPQLLTTPSWFILTFLGCAVELYGFDNLAGQTLYPIAMQGKGLIYPQNRDANEDPMRNDVIGAIC